MEKQNDTEQEENIISEWKKLLFHNGKPIDSHKLIHDALIPVSESYQKFSSRRLIDINVHSETANIILLTSGYVFVYRGDNTCLGVAVAPATIGITSAYAKFYNQKSSAQYYLMTGSVCKVYKCPIQTFALTIDNNNLWHDVARILANQILISESNNKILHSRNAHSIVKSILVELSRYSEQAQKYINVQEYVKQRTGLSRSIIMKILSEMKERKEITILRGKLLSISDDNVNS